MRLEIELGCIPFSIIILEMFLQLVWSPPVVHSIDWTWFGKAHTCLYKVTQLTVHVRAKTKLQYEVEGIVRRAPRQDCVEAQIWGRVPRISAALKVPKNTVASILLKWKKFGTPKTLPRAGCPAKLSNRGRRAWSGRWPRTQLSLWQSSRVPLWRWEILPEGQPSLQQEDSML